MRYETMSRGRAGAGYDQGLRSFMLSVYNYMASGVLLTGVVAMLFAQSGMAAEVFHQGKAVAWLIILSPFAFLLGMFVAGRNPVALQALFWGFCIDIGLSMSTVFLQYTGASIASAFFATSAAFCSLSLYGYTTKRDLGPIGTFLIMGLVGLVAVSFINLFAQSNAVHFLTGAAGLLIFAGLTAYDTQKIRDSYHRGMSRGEQTALAVMGALELYLDFLNLMLKILQFMGDRKGD